MKKVLKIIGYTLLFLIVSHLVIIGFFWWQNAAYLGDEKEDNLTYLKAHKTTTSREKLDQAFFNEAFNKDFYESDVILLGENHGFADIQKLDLHLVKHLNQKLGLKYYLAEMTPLLGEELNRYLNDSLENEILLKEVTEQLSTSIPQQSSREYFEKWRALRKYNQELPDTLKIRVLGIDKSTTSQDLQISRDSAMFLNFKNYIDELGLDNEQFYGLFGYFHVMQNPIGTNTAEPFASRLNRSKENSSSYDIVSIVAYHTDSEVYFPKNDQYPTPASEKLSFLNDDGPIILVKGIKDLEAATKPNSISLFDLDQSNSPFRNSQDLAGMKVNFFGKDLLPISDQKPTTKYFQYVILGRNSPALSKFY